MFTVADWSHVVQNFAQIRIWLTQKKIDTSCMKIYKLIILERITGIYNWTRTKHIVLMGLCLQWYRAEFYWKGKFGLYILKKPRTQEHVLHGNKSYVVNISLTKIQIVQ